MNCSPFDRLIAPASVRNAVRNQDLATLHELDLELVTESGPETQEVVQNWAGY